MRTIQIVVLLVGCLSGSTDFVSRSSVLGAGSAKAAAITNVAAAGSVGTHHGPWVSIDGQATSRFDAYSVPTISWEAWTNGEDCFDDGLDYVEVDGSDGFYDYAYLDYQTFASGSFDDESFDPAPDDILYYLYAEAFDCEFGYLEGDGQTTSSAAAPQPEYMRLVSSTDSTRDCQYCLTSNWQTVRQYQLYDQWGIVYQVPNIQMDESFSNETFPCPFTLTSNSGVTDSSGRWPDTFWFCHTHCCSGTCQDTADQAWTIHGNYFSIGAFHVSWFCDHLGITGPY